MARWLLGILWMLGALGCATQAPPGIREAPAVSLLPRQVAEAPAAHLGAQVRWGGTVLAVHNRERVTDVEVLALPLDGRGEPRRGSEPLGRFLARVEGFVDPAELPKDRRLTVAGAVAAVETHPVGEYPYRFPVVEVATRYLWPEPVPVAYPWPWYDPWYPFFDPWYPWYGRRYLW